MRRPETDSEGNTVTSLERVLVTFDMIAVDRAQRCCGYWNWALSSALTPALLQAIEGETVRSWTVLRSARTAKLALGAEPPVKLW
jgi:hypothetical protein